MPVFLDKPEARLDATAFSVMGWIASQSSDPVIHVRVGGASLPFMLYDRPDVRAVLPRSRTITGVHAVANLPRLRATDSVLVEIECDGEVASRRCSLGRIEPDAQASPQPDLQPNPQPIPQPNPRPDLQPDLRERARAWCQERLRCPVCAAPGEMLSHTTSAITCRKCGTSYPQGGTALNLISETAGIAAGVVPTDNVSSNPYTPDARDLIASTTSRGGWVLDCGAGSRPERLPGVINVEIADYPSSDVLAIGEALPFADNSFDAVLSLAVLEHVRDPFACARELVRVLKPGGELLADVPFLQPVHGYPNHYYNMTPAGLQNLFAGLGEVLDCRVPLHGHPIFAVQWLLGAYMAGLPETSRAQFGAMTIGEAASLSPHAFLPNPAAMELSLETQGIIGCVNSLRFRK